MHQSFPYRPVVAFTLLPFPLQLGHHQGITVGGTVGKGGFDATLC